MFGNPRGAGVVPKCWEAKVDYSSASSCATWVDLRNGGDSIFGCDSRVFLEEIFLGEDLKIPNLVNVLLLKLKY